MNPALLFVIYLLAFLCFLAGALSPLRGPRPHVFTAINLVSLGLALVTLVPLLGAGQAAF